MLSAPNQQKVRREQPKAQRSMDPQEDRIEFAFRSEKQNTPTHFPGFRRFPIIDKYFQGNTSLDDIREIMTYYKQPQQFINQLHELNYLSDKVHKKIMKKLK